MIQTTRYDDVSAYRLSWRRSQVVGYSVHVFEIRGVLVDTGFPGVAAEFAALLAERRPRGAFLTHQHEDHAGNLELVARAGVPIAADPATLSVLRKRQRIGLYRRFTWESMPRLETPIAPFSDGKLSLVASPGHCDDHHVVWDDETGTLFSGDLFLGVKVRIAHPDEDPRLLVRTLRTIASRSPARVFCAHRGFVAQGVQALLAKADWLDETIARIDGYISTGWDDDAIRREVLGKRTLTHVISRGDYSPDNLVRALRSTSAVNATPSAPRERR